MPKYWGKQIFTHGRFPGVGQKQKTDKREKERPKVGNNNGQLRIANATLVGARKAAWAKKLGMSCDKLSSAQAAYPQTSG